MLDCGYGNYIFVELAILLDRLCFGVCIGNRSHRPCCACSGFKEKEERASYWTRRVGFKA